MAHDPDYSILFTVLEWIGKIFVSALAGVYSAYKWFCRKLESVEAKASASAATLQGQLDILDSDTTKRMGHMDARIQEHATRLAVGERDFENLRQQLDQVLEGQLEMAKKQDRVLELVIDLRQVRHRQ